MEAGLIERRSFFERPEEPRPIRITSRDLALLKNVARLRLASSAQLSALDGGSAQNVSRSLHALWENGFLERPEAQVASRILYKGSRPTVYGLARKGARLLRDHGIEVRRRLLDGIDKSRGAGWRFVEHTASISDFMVQLEVAARERPDVRVIERREILESAPKSKYDRLVKLESSIRLGGTLRRSSVVPDAFFGLQVGNNDTKYYMVEIDRGEMPVDRYVNTQRTYFSKKMLTYYEAARQHRHAYDLGISNFRVLTVTTTERRIERMVNAIKLMTGGRGSSMFLFETQEAVSKAGPLDLQWLSGKDVRMKITE
jgi:Replication-relaxation